MMIKYLKVKNHNNSALI